MKQIKKTRCADCRHFCWHTGAPLKERGVTLQPGQRYCMAGKKPRLFRPSDPKVYPPKWCPAKITPPALCIYESRADWSVFHAMEKRNSQHRRTPYRPSPHHYVLRLTGTALSEAREFYQKVAECRRQECYVALATVKDLLGVEVRGDEIVKFDDGILPVFFYVESGRSGMMVRQVFQYGEGISDE